MAAGIVATLWLAAAGSAARGASRHVRPLALVGAAASASAALLAVAVEIVLDPTWTPEVAVVAASALLPASLLTHRVKAIAARVDRVIIQTLRAAAVGAVVAVAYVVVVVGLGGRPRGGERMAVLLATVAAAVALVTAGPLLGRVTRAGNRLAYGHPRDPSAIVDEFNARLARPLRAEEQLLQLAESLRSALSLSRVDIWTAGDDLRLVRVVSLPHRGARQLVIDESTASVVASAGVRAGTWLQTWLPDLAGSDSQTTRFLSASVAGELFGCVVVERPHTAGTFTTSEEEVLAEVAATLGMAMQGMKLDAALRRSLEDVRVHAAELEQSRARLVTAADTERRRIERDLHDGAQQRLSALILKVGVAERAAPRDPSRAAAMLGEVKTELRGALAEIRALAHGIYPPALESGGLAVALVDVAERSPLDVELDVDADRFAATTEAAVYFCCLEALHNAEKHARGATRVRITVDAEGNGVRFSVVDDGTGFDTAAARPGHGLTGIRDRIGALGGTVDVRSTGGGTTVAGSVPR